MLSSTLPERGVRRKGLNPIRSLALATLLALPAGAAMATPSSTYWTPMTLDIQPFGVLHWGIDNYFTVFRKAEDGAGDFPTDAGLTVGVLPFEKLQMEVGVDLLEPSDHPLYWSFKLGSPEGALVSGSPALQVGLFNAGPDKDATNYNIGYAVIGKPIPSLGRPSVGPSVGTSNV